MTCKQGGTTSVRSLWTDFVTGTASHSDTLALGRLGNPCASHPTLKHHKKLTMLGFAEESESTTPTSPPAYETTASPEYRQLYAAYHAGWRAKDARKVFEEEVDGYMETFHKFLQPARARPPAPPWPMRRSHQILCTSTSVTGGGRGTAAYCAPVGNRSSSSEQHGRQCGQKTSKSGHN